MAPIHSCVENQVRGDGAPVPTSPQTPLAVGESIWAGEGIKEEISGGVIFGYVTQIHRSEGVPHPADPSVVGRLSADATSSPELPPPLYPAGYC